MFAQRAQLGETVTQWLAAHPEIALVDIVVAQSSDAQYHCVSICLFFTGELTVEVEAGLDSMTRQGSAGEGREGDRLPAGSTRAAGTGRHRC